METIADTRRELTTTMVDLIEIRLEKYMTLTYTASDDAINYIADVLSIIREHVIGDKIPDMCKFINITNQINIERVKYILEPLKYEKINDRVGIVINYILTEIMSIIKSHFTNKDRMQFHIQNMRLIIHDYRIDERINDAIEARLSSGKCGRDCIAPLRDTVQQIKEDPVNTHAESPSNAVNASSNSFNDVRSKAKELSDMITKMVNDGALAHMTITITSSGKVTINEEL